MAAPQIQPITTLVQSRTVHFLVRVAFLCRSELPGDLASAFKSGAESLLHLLGCHPLVAPFARPAAFDLVFH
jgi:hypothetical protein